MGIMNKIKKIQLSDIIGAIKLISSYIPGKTFKLIDKNIWLITERPDDARDNGYYLFKYIRENYPNEKVYYAINTKSVDFDKIKIWGNYIEFSSFKHYIYYWAAKYNISSQIGTGEPSDKVCLNLEKLGVIKNKKVFLQHGVIKDILNFALYDNCKVDLFICGAKPEYEFVKKEFGYNKNAIKYLGLCRFDNLHELNINKKQILIMPTWRTWLNDIKSFQEINKEEYFSKYNSLLNNIELINFIEKEGITIIFYPHDNMQKYINFFNVKSRNIVIANKKEYDVQQLLKESAILITDYSSVFFDFGYMEKPVIYYQFDLDKYRNNHYKEGYFKYERDGFGKVIKTEEILVKELIINYNNELKLEDTYKQRINNFFELRDSNNCERTYREIKLL